LGVCVYGGEKVEHCWGVAQVVRPSIFVSCYYCLIVLSLELLSGVPRF